MEMGKVATVGLAPAVFGPWMNITGSGLANWWRRQAMQEGLIEDDAPEPASASDVDPAPSEMT
jgi:BASS family bile acid:Na+ symporter